MITHSLLHYSIPTIHVTITQLVAFPNKFLLNMTLALLPPISISRQNALPHCAISSVFNFNQTKALRSCT